MPMVCHMSEMARERIPALTLGWRLKMALGDMAAQDMADALEVSRGTVSRWMADKGAPPKSIYVKQWALITATDSGWLMTGEQAPPRTPANGRVTRQYHGPALTLIAA